METLEMSLAGAESEWPKQNNKACNLIAGDNSDTPSSDFISTYARYADVLEAPRQMHEHVAIQIIASILNRNGVTIPHGPLTYTLDLWTLILSVSGLGRSTLVSLARPVLNRAGLQDLILSTQWGSEQALYQGFVDRPSGLFIWGEMSEHLKRLNEPNFGSAKQWLTDRYDNLTVPESITYRHTGKKRDTPPIVFKCPPRSNITATSSDDWFFPNLATEDSAGGFLPRWILVRVDGPTKDVPTPPQPDPSLEHSLAEFLSQVNEISGKADLSCILNDYEDWYGATKRRFESQPNKALAIAYFNRHRVHVLKLAVIYEVSQSLSLRVSPEAWQRAVSEAAKLEHTIYSLLPTGMSKIGYGVARMEETIKCCGAEGILQSGLTSAFRHTDPRERDGQLKTLLEAGTVVAYRRPSEGGRPPRILVHKDYAAKHEAEYPDDRDE